jgi:hypothetical protein
MSKKNTIKDEGCVIPHLLDSTSDYNNFANLSYFIGEYKKAVQIINQCNNFYYQFLRTKLYNYDQLKDININPYKIFIYKDEYIKHCRNLESYIVNRWLEKEINSSLKTYKLVFNGDCYINKVQASYWNKRYNEWELMPSKDSYIQNFEYLQKFKHHFESDAKYEKDAQYTRDAHIVFGEKILLEYVNPKLVDESEVFDLTLYKWDYQKNKKTKKYEDVYTPLKKTVKCTLLKSEENKLISILREAAVRFDNLYDKIKQHPEKYIKEWNEYLEFVKDNYKYIHIYTSQGYNCSENYPGAKIDKEYEKTRDSIDALFFPLELIIDKDKYLFEGYEYVNATGFKKDSIFDDDKNTYHPISYTKLLNEYLIPNYGEYYENEKKRWFEENKKDWYYVIIDSIAYRFTNCISAVKIELEEEDNILQCDYETEERYQKWRWPSDSPYVVTKEFYDLRFSTLTNEPVYYNMSKDTYEEKQNRRY